MTKNLWHWILALICYAVVLGVCLIVTWFIYVAAEKDLPKAANIADAFGAAGALFTAFAFVGVIQAILLQLTELELQRQELHHQRVAIEKSADAQQKSEMALREQVNAQFFTAYLNALRDMAVYGDITKHGFEQRHVYDKLTHIIESLDKQASTTLGINFEPTTPTAHVAQCLDRLCQRAIGIRGRLPSIGGPIPAEILQKLHEVSDDFDRLLDDQTRPAMSESFLAYFTLTYLYVTDLKRGASGSTAKECAELIDLLVEQFTELRRLC